MIYTLLGFSLAFASAIAQTAPPCAARSVPTFTGQFIAAGKQYRYTVAGGSPERGGTTTIPTVLVPVSLVFEGQTRSSGKKRWISVASDVSNVVGSPIFQKFAFATGTTQYG
ncbi:MAG: hypothetical protein ACRD11_11730, partial [Terriglobia bacterium]